MASFAAAPTAVAFEIIAVAKVDPDQVVNILRETGNCISASIPMGIHKLMSEEKLKKGETLFICGTSAGFSIGSLLYIHD